jgi:hypothetical protein
MPALRHERSDCPKPRSSLWRLRVKDDAQSVVESSHLYLSHDGYTLTYAGHQARVGSHGSVVDRNRHLFGISRRRPHPA